MSSNVVMAKRIFDVSGNIIIPGTRKVEKFAARVLANDMRQGSVEMSNILNNKYQSKLPRGQKFSSNFALMNLRWKEFHANQLSDGEVAALAVMGIADNSPPMKIEEDEED